MLSILSRFAESVSRGWRQSLCAVDSSSSCFHAHMRTDEKLVTMVAPCASYERGFRTYRGCMRRSSNGHMFALACINGSCDSMSSCMSPSERREMLSDLRVRCYPLLNTGLLTSCKKGRSGRSPLPSYLNAVLVVSMQKTSDGVALARSFLFSRTGQFPSARK